MGQSDGIIFKGKTFRLRRRVPVRYADVEPRVMIEASLKTGDLAQARAKAEAEAMWRQLEKGWKSRMSMRHREAEQRFAAAREIAQRRGFGYVALNDMPSLPDEELLARVMAITGYPYKPDKIEAAALLGEVEAPSLTVSEALERYWHLTETEHLKKDATQKRVSRNPKLKVIRAFIALVGDLPLSKLTRSEFLRYRDWLAQQTMRAEKPIKISNANQEIGHLTTVLRTIDDGLALGLDLPMQSLKLRNRKEKKAHRPPFSSDWIRDRILAPGALDRLNAQARGVLLVMINTGCRPSEIVALTANTIHLDAPVTFIEILDEDREVKTSNAFRKVPLVGVALEAVRENPAGFPRYKGKAPNVSGLVNKFMRENGMMETPKHVMYSLRHSCADRMLASNIHDRIQADLMGHRYDRVRYGEGASLEQMRDALETIAF